MMAEAVMVLLCQLPAYHILAERTPRHAELEIYHL